MKPSLLVSGSSGKTSMAAPPRWPLLSASARAGMSTTVPRLALRGSCRGFMAASCAAPIIPRVCGVSGTWSVTKSAWPSSSSSVLIGSCCPSGSLAAMSKNTTRMPIASAMTPICRPMCP